MTLKDHFHFLLLPAAVLGSLTYLVASPAPQNPPAVHVTVQMVQLNVAVTDRKGRYVTALQPEDFMVTEDGTREQVAMFAEGDNSPRTIKEIEASRTKPPQTTVAPGATAAPPGPAGEGQRPPLAAASIFVLFDTSNYMYRGFVFAQDAIADFVRSLQGPDRVAFYSYSRDLYRASSLTADRIQVLHGVRSTVAGDDAALYDAMLLTLRDAGALTGRRVIVVFSNGPDDASVAPPEDVEALAQSEGVSVYMISTRQAQQDPLSAKVFGRISLSTGGEAYFARNWTEEQAAFTAVRNDLAHLYSLYYYPQPNPNRGWRAITVKLTSQGMKKYRIRARTGYWPLPPPTVTEAAQ